MQKITLNTPAGSTEILVGERLSGHVFKRWNWNPSCWWMNMYCCQHHDIFESFRSITIPSGEVYKTLQTVENIYRELVTLEADRSTLLVGVGGGLATDVAGFVASTFPERNPLWIYFHHLARTGRCKHWREEWGESGWL